MRAYYAIADVAAFVRPGNPVDLEANRRGDTLYGADAKITLHPKALSEGATSLLTDQVRPALLWTIELGHFGQIAGVDVRRARAPPRQARLRRRATGDRCGQCRSDVGGAPDW